MTSGYVYNGVAPSIEAAMPGFGYTDGVVQHWTGSFVSIASGNGSNQSYNVSFGGTPLSATAFNTNVGRGWNQESLTFTVTGETTGALTFTGLDGSRPFFSFHRGHSTHMRSGCFMRPACASASSLHPQK